MFYYSKRFLCLVLVSTLVGCGHNLAPVTELKWRPYSLNQKTHVVQRGETLFAIAFRYDTDYRTLARLNHINPPYSLRIGQVLNVHGVAHRHAQQRSVRRYNSYRPVQRPRTQAVIHSPARRFFRSSSGWLWPVNGHVATSFIPAQGKKGINIACKKDEKVIASAAGIVAYAGNGLVGYGNLIIIKHSNEYLTAYGNNARMMVSEGQQVKAGQIIAVAGMIDHKYTGVHFEIRKAGIPVNPLNYLQKG